MGVPECEYCLADVAHHDDVTESLHRHGVILCRDCLNEKDNEMIPR